MSWEASFLVSLDISPDGEDGECAYLQFIEVTRPKNMSNETLLCVCLRWSTDVEVNHNLGNEACSSDRDT